MKIIAVLPVVAMMTVTEGTHVRVSVHSKQQQQPATQGVGKVWEQCSGENFSRDCEANNKCVVFNKWYGQCQPTALDNGTICGEASDANNWKNDCKQGLSCVQNGAKFFCQDSKASATTTPAIAPPSNSPLPKVWEPCGGKIDNQEWKMDCADGATCLRFNEWYSQCQPVPAQNSPLPKIWEQCGGQGWTKECADKATTCVKDNEWYSQCRPKAHKNKHHKQQAPTNQPPPASYGTCGGKTSQGVVWAVECAPNNVCYTFNEWYSQCLPIPATNAPAPKTWEQCAGIGWEKACASANDFCNKDPNNQWWAGCAPKSAKRAAAAHNKKKHHHNKKKHHNQKHN